MLNLPPPPSAWRPPPPPPRWPSPGVVWRTSGGKGRIGIVLVIVVSAACGAFTTLVLIRPPSPLSDAVSAPFWTLVFPVVACGALGIAGGIAAAVRTDKRRSAVAGLMATVPGGLTALATLGVSAPRGDNDGLWVLVYPMTAVCAVVLFVVAATTSLLTRPLSGAWLGPVFAASLALTLLAMAPGRVEASRAVVTSWVTVEGGGALTRDEAADILMDSQRHAADIDGGDPQCGFAMTGTVARSIVCGPTTAPVYPYFPGAVVAGDEPMVLSYQIDRVGEAWRAVPPPVEAEVPPGEPPLVGGPYARPVSPFEAVLDIEGRRVDFDR